MRRCHVVVHGHVQGVFFRDSVRRRAQQAGLAGWVRNRADGTVEAVFEGDPAGVARLVAFCREGPPGARVEAVETTAEDPRGEAGFGLQ